MQVDFRNFSALLAAANVSNDRISKHMGRAETTKDFDKSVRHGFLILLDCFLLGPARSKSFVGK
jgi:hypothetical protein